LCICIKFTYFIEKKSTFLALPLSNIRAKAK
jgi:hypothetical protein